MASPLLASAVVIIALVVVPLIISACRTVPTPGGTQMPTPCVLPFKFQGEVYNACTGVLEPEGKFWCSTEVDGDGDHVLGEDKWGHCDPKYCGFRKDTNARRASGNHREIMVIGGYWSGGLSVVEVVSLGSGDNVGMNCSRSLGRLPEPRRSAVAQAPFPAATEATVCGGASDGWAVESCLIYDFGSDSWREAPFGLTKERFDAASVLLDNGTMVVFGGRDNNLDIYQSTEVLHSTGGTFQLGPELPVPALAPCALKINSTHVFLAGGYNNVDGWMTRAYLLSVDDNKWTRLPDMEQGRDRHSCGLVRGVDVVVAGGQGGPEVDSVEVYSLEAGEWREGPRLPATAKDMAAVQLDGTFAVAGGYAHEYWNEFVYVDAVYVFDRVNYSWTEKKERLKTRREEAAAVLVPKEFDLCD